MNGIAHSIELVIDGKGVKTTGRKVVLKIDGEPVYDFDSLHGTYEPDLDELEASAFRFLLESANAAFGHAHRFRITISCGEQPKTFSELKKSFKMTSPTLDYHLKRLTESWVLYKNEEEKYALTLLGQLILHFFSKFFHEARKLKKELQNEERKKA